MLKFLGWGFCLFCVMPAWANVCLGYKSIPRILINTPDWEKKIVQPIQPMDLWHGNVTATLIENYQIITDVKPVDGGLCVILKTVDAEIGYNNFIVQIDIRHKPNSCEYNAVLGHENKHINTYLDILNDSKVDLYKSVYGAADSVMPIFVKSQQDVEKSVGIMHEQLINHPDLVLIKQKIKAAEEIKNKQVDRQENSAELKKCKK